MSRYWGPNIVIDGSWYNSAGANGHTKPGAISAQGVAANNVVESYEYQVQDVLRKIERSSVGKLLIDRINSASKELRIVPVGTDQFLLTKARPVACLPDLCAKVVTDSVIWYEPTTWLSSATAAIDPGKHMQPDDVLFHEMVHALRQFRGLFKPTRLSDGFQFVEEYYAVLLTNMYVTETGRPQDRRASHILPFETLSSQPGTFADTPLDFYFTHQDELDDFIKEMPDLCKPLGNIANPISWNPIRIAMNRHIFDDIGLPDFPN